MRQVGRIFLQTSALNEGAKFFHAILFENLMNLTVKVADNSSKNLLHGKVLNDGNMTL